jgi:pimeloyl-ACP methyl ester carboxylesterase
MSVRRGYATVSFGQMHYRYAGRPGAPVLVLLHQTPSHSAMYEPLMEQLAGEFRLIAPDTPGMGQSDTMPGKMTIARLAAGIAEFLDELGVDHCYLFGHHTGASIAVQMAASNPVHVDGIALSGPPLIDEELAQKLRDGSEDIPKTADGSHLTTMWQRMYRKDGNAPLEVLERDVLSAFSIGHRYADAYNAVIDHDMSALLSQVSCPVLAFAGTEDVLFPHLDAVCDKLGNVQRSSIDNERSFVCETSAEKVAGLLREFFVREAA